MGKLVSKGVLAKMAGLSPSSVSKALKGKLGQALVGNKIDSGHPKAIEFVQKGQRKGITGRKQHVGSRDRKPPEPNFDPPPPQTHLNPTEDEIEQTLAMLPADISELQDLSLRELVGMFGTVDAFNDFLKATKTIEDIHEKRLKNAEVESKLVSRDLVERGVIGPFDNMHKRLLTDGARTISRQVMAMARAGRTDDDGEKYVNERISSFIRAAKARVRKAIQGKK